MDRNAKAYLLKDSDCYKGLGKVLPMVEIAAVAIMDGSHIMAVFNEHWGAFTLPMSKRRSWDIVENGRSVEQLEEWSDTAIRAAAEWMRQTFSAEPEFLTEVAAFQQSDRDRIWKRYQVQVYRLCVEKGAPLPAGRTAEWLTVDEFLDPKRKPISLTARNIVEDLMIKRIIR